MTNPQTITQLIEDLKAAEVGTREFDVRIALAFGIEPEGLFPLTLETVIKLCGGVESAVLEGFFDRENSVVKNLPQLSTSIDAAMTTIREGWSFRVMKSGTGDQGQAEIWDPMKTPSLDNTIRVIGCASPAMALCIASLSAMLEELETA